MFVKLALLALLIAPAYADEIEYGTWPENDQRGGKCEFQDWSKYAYIKRVYDGDTIYADIDMAYQLMWIDQRIRFYGVNAPEIRTKDPIEKAEGLVARDWLSAQILHKWVVITTHKYKLGKFGRKLASVCRNGVDMTQVMLTDGLLFEVDY